MPLYLYAIKRILRELRTEQQASNESFNYAKFKKQVIATKMTEAQLVPSLSAWIPWKVLCQRNTQVDEASAQTMTRAAKKVGGTDWSIKVCRVSAGIL